MKALLMIFALYGIVATAQDCSQYNQTASALWNPAAIQDHYTGSHHFNNTLNGACSYSGSTPGQPCASTCSTSIIQGGADTGQLLGGRGDTHYVNWNSYLGTATVPSGGSECAGTAAVLATRCSGCGTAITFVGTTQDGLTAVPVFPPSTLYTDDRSNVVTCSPASLPQLTCSGGAECCSGQTPVCSNGTWTCSLGATPCPTPPTQGMCGSGGAPVCQCTGWGCQQTGNSSPIIIDTSGTGFQLTNAANGVRFDLNPTKPPEQLAWTMAESRNGWLALPHDGKVETGRDLFGNFTPQPPSSDPNGFLALAVYDLSENGGNGDGIIDWHDSVFEKLRVWIDENHDGKAQPNELYTLPAVGIYSISLAYTESKFTDQWGNQFRYKGAVNPTGNPSGDHVDRVIYDVFLGSAGFKGYKIDPAMELTRDPLKDMLK